MVTAGYLPTREQMRSIAGAAKNLYQVIRRWQKHSHLPGFPVNRGNVSALRAVFGLERALNPKCLAWSHPSRVDPPVQNWGDTAADGLAWLRRLLDIVMENNEVGSMAASPDFESWAAERPTMPETVSVVEQELLALRLAIRLIPHLDDPSGRPAPEETITPSPRAAEPTRLKTTPLTVVLFSPTIDPVVLGRRKSKLTLAQFSVVKALIEAGERGLSKSRLQALTGDAVNVLKRLAKSDPDWGAVIQLPGGPGRGYRLGACTHTDNPTLPHTSPH